MELAHKKQENFDVFWGYKNNTCFMTNWLEIVLCKIPICSSSAQKLGWKPGMWYQFSIKHKKRGKYISIWEFLANLAAHRRFFKRFLSSLLKAVSLLIPIFHKFECLSLRTSQHAEQQWQPQKKYEKSSYSI